jgi:hypothetical protein
MLYILFLISRTNLGGVSHNFVRILLVASVKKSDSYAHMLTPSNSKFLLYVLPMHKQLGQAGV